MKVFDIVGSVSQRAYIALSEKSKLFFGAKFFINKVLFRICALKYIPMKETMKQIIFRENESL